MIVAVVLLCVFAFVMATLSLVALRVLYFVGLLLAVITLGVFYVGAAAGVIAFAVLCQLLGSANFGWAIAGAGVTGLATAWLAARAVFRNLNTLVARFTRSQRQPQLIRGRG